MAPPVTPRLWFHWLPCKLVAFGSMGLWLDVWPGRRELVPNIKGNADGLQRAFKSCLGTTAFWFKGGYGPWECQTCGIKAPTIVQAADHPFTREAFAACNLPVVLPSNGKGE